MTIYDLLRGCSCYSHAATVLFHRKLMIVSRFVSRLVLRSVLDGIGRIVVVVVLNLANRIQDGIQLTARTHSFYWRNGQTDRMEKKSRSPIDGTSQLHSLICIFQILSIFRHSSWVLEVKGLQLPGRSVLPWSVDHRAVAW